MNLIGDRFDVLSHVVDEFQARFLIKDDIGNPGGDEFVAVVIIVLIKNAAVDIGVLVDIVDQGLNVEELWWDSGDIVVIDIEIMNGVHVFSPWLTIPWYTFFDILYIQKGDDPKAVPKCVWQEEPHL